MGGGIIVYHRDHLKAKKIELVRVPTTFEALAGSLASERGPTTLLALYRPVSSRPTTVFYDEFIDLLDQFALYNTQLVLVGDLNLHLEDSSLPETVEFVAVLEQFGLKQHVTESTHVSGDWLDVVVTRDDCQVSDCDRISAYLLRSRTSRRHNSISLSTYSLHHASDSLLEET